MADGSRPAALSGTFADFKLVKTRSVAVIMVEVAIEQADEALAILGGVPKPGAEVHVALARLRDIAGARHGGKTSKDEESQRSPGGAERSVRAKRVYDASDEGAKAVTRAAIKIKDRGFQSYLRASGVAHADQILKEWLGITSKSEIADPKVLPQFLELERRAEDYLRFGEVTA